MAIRAVPMTNQEKTCSIFKNNLGCLDENFHRLQKQCDILQERKLQLDLEISKKVENFTDICGYLETSLAKNNETLSVLTEILSTSISDKQSDADGQTACFLGQQKSLEELTSNMQAEIDAFKLQLEQFADIKMRKTDMDEKMALIKEAISHEKLNKKELFALEIRFLLEKESLMQELERKKIHLLNVFNAASDKRLRENEHNCLTKNIDLSLQFQELGARVNGLMAKQDILQAEQQELARNVGLTDEVNAIFAKKSRDVIKDTKERTARYLSMEKDVEELREELSQAKAAEEAEGNAHDKLCKRLERKRSYVTGLKTDLAKDWQKNDEDAVRLSCDEHCLARMEDFVQYLQNEIRRTQEIFEVVEAEDRTASHPAWSLSESELEAQRSGFISLLLVILQTACKLGLPLGLSGGSEANSS